MSVNCVIHEIIGCPMCEKVKKELLTPYQRKGITSTTTCNIGIRGVLPAEISKEMYDYIFLCEETGRTVTPTMYMEDIKDGDYKITFLQAMNYNTLVRIFEEELRHCMGGER